MEEIYPFEGASNFSIKCVYKTSFCSKSKNGSVDVLNFDTTYTGSNGHS